MLRRVADFSRSDEGAVTVEGVLWLPVYGFFFTLIADTALMFNGQAQAQRVIQDVNRLASYGYYLTEEEVEDRGKLVLSHLSENATVESLIDTTAGTISTKAVLPASDLMAIGLITKFTNIEVTVTAQHVIES